MRTGLEPATPGVTGRYSNQLNYRTICSDLCVFLERGCKGTQKIGTSKFFAYFFVKKLLFDLDLTFFVLSLYFVKFRDNHLEDTVIDLSFNLFFVGIVGQEQSLAEFCV